jgi:hypothetical protein
LEQIAIIMHRILTLLVAQIGYRQIVAGLSLLPCLVLAWFMPKWGDRVIGPIEKFGMRLAERKRLAIGLSRLVFVSALFLAPFHPYAQTLGHPAPLGIENRAMFEAQLRATPGEHLAIVRYFPGADTQQNWAYSRIQEWVYNEADIDRAKVVWARDIPGVDIHPLLNYFRGRRVWLVEPDARPPRMSPYSELPAP